MIRPELQVFGEEGHCHHVVARVYDFSGDKVDKNPPTSQERSVQSLIWEDPTCHGATKPMHHHNWSPHALEAVLSKRSYCNERGPCIATKSSFRSPQLEKGCGQQWRPSTTKKKKSTDNRTWLVTVNVDLDHPWVASGCQVSPLWSYLPPLHSPH